MEKEPSTIADVPKTFEQEDKERERKEFDLYLGAVREGAEMVGPVTLRREYNDPDIEKVLDEIQISDIKYDSRWNETTMKIKLPQIDNDLDVLVRTMGRKKTYYENGEKVTAPASDGEEGYYFTQTFAKGGYMGVTLTFESDESEKKVKILSVGMPEGHQTPFVQNLIKRVLELKK